MKTTIEERKKMFDYITEKYPDMIPVIVTTKPKSTLPPLTKNKFLVPNDYLVYQFAMIIRQRLLLPKTHSLFLFVDDRFLLK
mmetsp:Transcript_20104/g.23289  ORF Transcript_20104/g.23289 Transcript_20104/m.23289 type:complete len:82 (+) Transcript_20104:28-273(+)